MDVPKIEWGSPNRGQGSSGDMRSLPRRRRLKLSTELKLAEQIENHEWGNHFCEEHWPLSETFDFWKLSYDITTSPSRVACEIRDTLDGSLTTFVSRYWYKVRWAAYQHLLNKSGGLRKVGTSWVCDSSPVTVPCNRGKLISDCSYRKALIEIMAETQNLTKEND